MRHLSTLLLCLAVNLLLAQSFNGKQKFSDPGTRTVFARLGHSLALTDSFAFMSAPQSPYDTADANPISNAGFVMVYKKNSFGAWSFHQKLQSSNRNHLAQFGWSMAVQDSTLVIGARGEYVGFPANGAAHVFTLQNDRWVHSQRLISNDTANNSRFGCSVAINGNTIVIGAERNPSDSLNQNSLTNSGSAYVYKYQNGNWAFAEKLSASVSSSGHFGMDVALQGDEILVSAPEEWLTPAGQLLGYYGAIYRFKENSLGNWNQNLHITDTIFQGGGTLGAAIAWEDSNLIISNRDYSYDTLSAPGAVFHLTLNQNGHQLKQIIHQPQPLDNDNFGDALVLNWPNLFIGVPNEDHDANQANAMASAGGVYWFQYNTAVDSFEFRQIILPQDRIIPLSTFDSFGYDLAYHNGALIVGAPNDDEDSLNLNYVAGAGSVYFMDSICNVISTLIRDTLCFGESLSFNGLNLDSSGIYQTTLSAANGCDSLISLDLVVLPQIMDTLSITACAQYQLPGGTIVNQSGQYIDTLQSASGCDSILITNLQIDTVNTAISFTISGNVAMALANNAQYQWFDCDNQQILVGDTNQMLTSPYPGNFAVIISQGNCTDTSDCVFLSDFNLGETGIEGFEVYPNPTKKELYFSRPIKAGKLIDAQGRSLMDINGESIDLTSFEPGVYWIWADGFVVKVVKE